MIITLSQHAILVVASSDDGAARPRQSKEGIDSFDSTIRVEAVTSSLSLR